MMAFQAVSYAKGESAKNLWEEEENAGTAFFAVPKIFLKAFFLRVVNSPDCAVKG